MKNILSVYVVYCWRYPKQCNMCVSIYIDIFGASVMPHKQITHMQAPPYIRQVHIYRVHCVIAYMGGHISGLKSSLRPFVTFNNLKIFHSHNCPIHNWNYTLGHSSPGRRQRRVKSVELYERHTYYSGGTYRKIWVVSMEWPVAPFTHRRESNQRLWTSTMGI